MADRGITGLVLDRVHRRVERRATSSGASFSRLIRSGSFQPNLHLSDYGWKVFRPLYDQVCPVARRETMEGFSNLVANLVYYGRTSVALSLNHNHSLFSRHRRYGRVRRSVIDLVKGLNERGLIGMKKGFRYEGQASMYTRVWATERFIRDLDTTGLVEFRPKELVELRDWKTGELLPYRDTAFTKRVRRTLSSINAVNAASNIRLGRSRVNVFLVAVFLDSFQLYGRLHSYGALQYQGLPKEDRKMLTIDGKPVIELDFLGLHPHLLYAAKGVQLEGDPYDAVCEGTSERVRSALRPFLKVLLLCMLNSESFRQAESAANYWLLVTEDGARLRGMGFRRSRPLMERFLDAHGALSGFFFRGGKEGLRVMNKDAQIALSVVEAFAKKGVPVLPVHDSFITSSEHRDLLEGQMRASYSDFTGGFRIPIH